MSWQTVLKKKPLVGGQKKLDKDKDGDIDGEDFQIMSKDEKDYILWVSDKKLQAWVNGRGPFDASEVNLMIRKDPDKYVQSISKY